MKNGGKGKLENLFHGTRGTPPTLIYISEKGFNLNYANAGMWGKAKFIFEWLLFFSSNRSEVDFYGFSDCWKKGGPSA